MAEDKVELWTEGTDMRNQKESFSVSFPKSITEEEYQLIRWQIEYRRKCMNQGFDNLLELLDKQWETMKKLAEAKKG